MSEVKFIQIEPTNRCNFNCIYCCGRHLEPVDMDLDTFKKAIDSFPSLERIHIQGEGEPLLNPDFFNMVSYAKQKGIIVTTTTNGSLFTDRNIQYMIDSGLDSIGVSIDTVDEELFKKIRTGSLKSVINGIRKLKEKIWLQNKPNIAIGFRVTVMKSTLDGIPELFKLYSELNLDGGVLCQPLLNSPFYAQYYDDQLKAQFLSKEEKMIMIKKTLYWNRKIYIREDADTNNISVDSNSTDQSCKAIREELFINGKGDITFCCIIKETEDNSLGNIKTDSIHSIMEKREQIQKEAAMGKYPKICVGCNMLK